MSTFSFGAAVGSRHATISPTGDPYVPQEVMQGRGVVEGNQLTVDLLLSTEQAGSGRGGAGHSSFAGVFFAKENCSNELSRMAGAT